MATRSTLSLLRSATHRRAGCHTRLRAADQDYDRISELHSDVYPVVTPYPQAMAVIPLCSLASGSGLACTRGLGSRPAQKVAPKGMA